MLVIHMPVAILWDYSLPWPIFSGDFIKTVLMKKQNVFELSILTFPYKGCDIIATTAD